MRDRIVSEVRAGRLYGPCTVRAGEGHGPHQPNWPGAHTTPKGPLQDDCGYSGQSINDGVKYASVDQAVSIIQHLGRGTQLVKVDINDAYRIIPVVM